MCEWYVLACEMISSVVAGVLEVISSAVVGVLEMISSVVVGCW